MLFDNDTYMQNKVDLLNFEGTTANPSGGLWTTDSLSKVFEEQGFTPETHYSQYGASEGVSPYSDWSDDTYLTNKVTDLNATGYENPYGGDWTNDQLSQTFADNGLTAVEHYDTYGRKEGISPYAPPDTSITDDAVDIFQPDLYPESGSTTTSTSGIDFDNPYIQDLFGKIQSSTTDMEGNVDAYTRSAADSAEAAARTQARDYMPGLIDSLAQRGIVNSKLGQKSIQGLLSEIAEEAASKNYDASMEGAKMKQDIPQILGSLASLGNTSESTSESWNSDPSVPYSNIMDMYIAMM